MPAYSSHYIFAKEMMPFISENADFCVNEISVIYGTQGPDIFFCHRVLPWMIGKSLRKTGSLIHRATPEKVFEAMREYCSKSKNRDIALSYVWGFILHYALDRQCHPYVYYLQNKITSMHSLTNPHTAHNIVEFALDSYLLSTRMGINNPVHFNTAETLTEDFTVIEEISKLLEYVVPKVTGVQITKKQAQTALRDEKYIQKITFDRSGAKRAVTAIFEDIIAPFSHNFKFTAMMRPRDLEKVKKYANINKGSWKSPFCDGKRNESFNELFNIAIADAKRMLCSFRDGEDCNEFTENKSFLTGVEAK